MIRLGLYNPKKKKKLPKGYRDSARLGIVQTKTFKGHSGETNWAKRHIEK